MFLQLLQVVLFAWLSLAISWEASRRSSGDFSVGIYIGYSTRNYSMIFYDISPRVSSEVSYGILLGNLVGFFCALSWNFSGTTFRFPQGILSRIPQRVLLGFLYAISYDSTWFHLAISYDSTCNFIDSTIYCNLLRFLQKLLLTLLQNCLLGWPKIPSSKFLLEFLPSGVIPGIWILWRIDSKFSQDPPKIPPYLGIELQLMNEERKVGVLSGNPTRIISGNPKGVLDKERSSVAIYRATNFGTAVLGK